MEEVQKLAVRLVGRNGRRRFEQSSKDRLFAACLACFEAVDGGEV